MTSPNLPDICRDDDGESLDPADPVDPAAPVDLALVAEIVRRAGLDCRVDPAPPGALRARRAHGPGPWTVSAGSCREATAPLAFVGPTGSSRTRLLRNPDERHLAALVVLQALRPDPDEPFTHDEAAACGLADDLIWA
ncbi:hypothetical protein LWC33_30005 [Pseudonocardia sp. RS11V-5]|uniref:hypothetical protein n=1 Tax=Pseudonocardia terrae TaxID=2905831 RepID=UPI001E35FFBC|nr:hypothetical protein [Pseudonocardia terrae]MCE3555667.1 hypothetical protein [Pseudonocardia terrae]